MGYGAPMLASAHLVLFKDDVTPGWVLSGFWTWTVLVGGFYSFARLVWDVVTAIIDSHRTWPDDPPPGPPDPASGGAP